MGSDADGGDHTDPTRLTADEALTAMRDSGGFVVLRYDTGDSHIEYRYNPATNRFEQLCVAAIDTDDGPSLDSYYELSDATAKSLLTTPEGAEIMAPQAIAFANSHFPGVNTWPDELRLSRGRGRGRGRDDDEDGGGYYGPDGHDFADA